MIIDRGRPSIEGKTRQARRLTLSFGKYQGYELWSQIYFHKYVNCMCRAEERRNVLDKENHLF